MRSESAVRGMAGQETPVPLYPYQREGMRHLAFRERALLADEMGLGKTIQAIAACALLRRLGKAARALIVTPASLKTEWEEQIQRFTELPYQLIYGTRGKRLRLYASAPFFTIVNYEQMLTDALNVNRHLQPDIVILDEAQRIKNWSTKTAQAVKRLQSAILLFPAWQAKCLLPHRMPAVLPILSAPSIGWVFRGRLAQ